MEVFLWSFCIFLCSFGGKKLFLKLKAEIQHNSNLLHSTQTQGRSDYASHSAGSSILCWQTPTAVQVGPRSYQPCKQCYTEVVILWASTPAHLHKMHWDFSFSTSKAGIFTMQEKKNKIKSFSWRKDTFYFRDSLVKIML